MGSVGVASNVAQLASKFNQMNKGIAEENSKVGFICVRHTKLIIDVKYFAQFFGDFHKPKNALIR